MADKDTQTPPAAPSGGSAKTVKVDLVNGLPGRRVIDPAIRGAPAVTIESGETKRHVELAEWVAKELKQRHRQSKGRELQVHPAGQAPDPSKPADEDPDTDDE